MGKTMSRSDATGSRGDGRLLALNRDKLPAVLDGIYAAYLNRLPWMFGSEKLVLAGWNPEQLWLFRVWLNL